MARILISWLGTTDIKNLHEQGEDQKKAGPIHSILTHSTLGKPDELWLFMTPAGAARGPSEETRTEVVRKIRGICAELGTRLDIIRTPDNFPVADPSYVYEFMIQKLDARMAQRRSKDELFYNLTSGTPAMYAIQLHMADNSPFAGTALYTVPPELCENSADNVYRASLPNALSRLYASDMPHDRLFDEPNKKIYDQIRLKVANTKASVLIQGESGTGKSALARFIHQMDGRRCKRRLIEVNCAALGSDANSHISELFGHKKGSFTGAMQDRMGAFRDAHESTLFLDEVGEIPLEHQGLLLRALEQGKIKPLGADKEETVDVRVIAATNVDLPEAIRQGKFRQDLFFRLAQYTPRLKPVREYSRDQREELLRRILERVNADSRRPHELANDAREALLDYPWPGNIREMKFRLESICLLADGLITRKDVLEQLNNGDMNRIFSPSGKPDPAESGADLPHDLKEWLENEEARWLDLALRQCGTVEAAAGRLGMKKTTFFNRKKKLLGD